MALAGGAPFVAADALRATDSGRQGQPSIVLSPRIGREDKSSEGPALPQRHGNVYVDGRALIAG